MKVWPFDLGGVMSYVEYRSLFSDDDEDGLRYH
jgi:hypothetical protein